MFLNIDFIAPVKDNFRFQFIALMCANNYEKGTYGDILRVFYESRFLHRAVFLIFESARTGHRIPDFSIRAHLF
jgi:hypothetical protein